MYRVFAAIALVILLGSGVVAMADDNNEVENLRAEIIQLLNQIAKIRNQEVFVEHLDESPVFVPIHDESVEIAHIAPKGMGFLYHRPVVWESAGKGSPGIYDHRHEILLLRDNVEQIAVILDDRIVGVKDGSSFSSNYQDPVEAIAEYERLFPGVHDRDTKPLLEDHDVDLSEEFVPGDLQNHVLLRLFDMYPKTDHDIVIKLGDTIVGIRFSAGQRRWAYHKEVRLMLLGNDGISLHGYPVTLPEGIDYRGAARTRTNALGYLLISEIMRDITLLTHRIEWASTSMGLGAPSANSHGLSSVPRLAKKAERLFFGVTPKNKKLTTWGAIKSR